MAWKGKIIAALCFSSGPLWAVPLTWPEIVELALQQNPSLLAQRKSVEANEAAVRTSRNSVLPQLDLSSGYSESKGDPSGQWNAAGEASLNVFDKGAYADMAVSAARRDSSVAALQLVSAEIRRDLREVYVDLAFAQEEVDVAKRIYELRKKNAELVSLKYDSGRESKGNMLKAQAELKEALVSTFKTERALKQAQQELGRQLGREEKIEVVVEPIPVHSPSLIEDLDLVIDQHPTLRVSKAVYREAQKSLASERSLFWPTLSARYSRSFTGENYFPSYAQWRVSGDVNLPIFSGGPTATQNRIQTAKANTEKAEIELMATRLEVQTNLNQALTTLLDRIDEVTVQEDFLEASKQRNTESNIRYSIGLMNYEDWERAGTDLVNYERGYVRSRREAALAEAAWDFAKGRSLEGL
ncbi:MAG: hypothetical protein KCHDKBKB_01361 [Elusimicrobia bacterium]|nr:hypothetical protein [Elusimicrobiota bacterium]